MTPGDTELTRIPRPAYSVARDLVAEFRPPFVRAAIIAGTAVLGWSARVVVTLMMCPDPAASMMATARWLTWKNPARLTATSWSKSAGLYSVKGLDKNWPALLMTVSTRPNR